MYSQGQGNGSVTFLSQKGEKKRLATFMVDHGDRQACPIPIPSHLIHKISYRI